MNFRVSATVQLSDPRSGDSQSQKLFGAPSAVK